MLIFNRPPFAVLAGFIVVAAGLFVNAAMSSDADRQTVSALDTAYQAAVERGDVAVMGSILHAGMILVLGDGSVHTRADLLESARSSQVVFEHQKEDPGTQTVRMYGRDTAIVTARLCLKGRRRGRPFESHLWFSDTYVRTDQGWRYAFGQASIALPRNKLQAQCLVR
ncbi:MAG: nuclear transport factor 2 family protein [Steroidobacteraceae bacterium]